MAKNDDRPKGAAQANGVVALQPHPAAEIFPLMIGSDLGHLVDDIEQNGQREPIVIYDNMILDGRTVITLASSSTSSRSPPTGTARARPSRS